MKIQIDDEKNLSHWVWSTMILPAVVNPVEAAAADSLVIFWIVPLAVDDITVCCIFGLPGIFCFVIAVEKVGKIQFLVRK